MSAGLEPYPVYVSPGVGWLSELPADWDAVQLKRVADSVGETDHGPALPGTYLALENVVSWTGEIHLAETVPEGSQLKRFRRGDVLFGKLRPYLAKVTRPSFDGHCVSEFLVLRSRGAALSEPFLERVMRSASVIAQVSAMTDGARMPRAEWDDVGSMMVPIPPVEDQAAIVRYLDCVDSRIQRVIAAKERLIELLEEEIQAIIHRAVTRGLDPDVSLKPSGIDWLGDVPEHWEVNSLGGATSVIQTGPFGSQLHASEYVAGGVPVINPSHMRGGRIQPDPDVAVGPAKAAALQRHALRQGDLVTARRGELGRAALVTENEEGWLCGTGSMLLRTRREALSSKLLFRILSSPKAREHLASFSVGATMDNLNEGMLSRIRLALPPLSEQQTIVEHLDRSDELAASVVRRAEAHLSLMGEYRMRFISDVVTGKLDVREAAQKLRANPEAAAAGLEERLADVAA